MLSVGCRSSCPTGCRIRKLASTLREVAVGQEVAAARIADREASASVQVRVTKFARRFTGAIASPYGPCRPWAITYLLSADLERGLAVAEHVVGRAHPRHDVLPVGQIGLGKVEVPVGHERRRVEVCAGNVDLQVVEANPAA